VTENGLLKRTENGVLKRIFRPNREEMVGCWRTLYNEEFHNLYAPSYYLGDQIKEVEMVEHIAHMGEMRNS
jgi:hypothetical protein